MKLFDNLRMLPHVPGVQMQRNVLPRTFYFLKKVLFLAIPDDIMDVDRVVDEDKEADPNKVNGRWRKDD